MTLWSAVVSAIHSWSLLAKSEWYTVTEVADFIEDDLKELTIVVDETWV